MGKRKRASKKKRSRKTNLNVYRRGFPSPSVSSVSVLPHESRPAPAIFTTATNDALKHPINAGHSKQNQQVVNITDSIGGCELKQEQCW
jgi:hypothetical protein